MSTMTSFPVVMTSQSDLPMVNKSALIQNICYVMSLHSFTLCPVVFFSKLIIECNQTISNKKVMPVNKAQIDDCTKLQSIFVIL